MPRKTSTAYTTRRTSSSQRFRRKDRRTKASTASIKTRGGLKNVNAERAKLGLPEVELKYNKVFHDSQWVTKSGTTWSFLEDLNTISRGTGEEHRESNKVRWLPKNIRLRIKQATAESFDYRVMLIRQFDKTTSHLQPDDVFDNTTYWSFCTYKKGNDRSSGTSRFKVLYDKQFRWSTVNGNSTAKFLKLRLPTVNTEYDEDVSTGGTKTNSLILVVYTDATVSSASHELSCDFNYEFLDQ